MFILSYRNAQINPLELLESWCTYRRHRNHRYIFDEVKDRLSSRNACHHSVQKPLSFHLQACYKGTTETT